jgi:hypothetical protein
MRARRPKYVVDPDDPRAPPQDVWDRMTAAERAQVLEALPSQTGAALPDSSELIARLDARLSDAVIRAEQEERRAERAGQTQGVTGAAVIRGERRVTLLLRSIVTQRAPRGRKFRRNRALMGGGPSVAVR